MRLYTGRPTPQGRFLVFVTLVMPPPATSTERLLPHLVKHSPDGFAWGYDGPGPHELARCIVIDALGHPAASCAECKGTGRIPVPGARERRPYTCGSCTGTGVAVTNEGRYRELVPLFFAHVPRQESWVLTDALIRWWWVARGNLADAADAIAAEGT